MKRLSTTNTAGIKGIKRLRQAKTPGINEVLKTAYRLYFRGDKHTRLALRRCLG